MVDTNKIYLEKEPKDLLDLLNILYPGDAKSPSATDTFYKEHSSGKLLLQCAKGRMRSFDDIYIIANTYFPGVDIRDVFREVMLFKVTLEDFQERVIRKSISNCSTMKRIRVTNSLTPIKSLWFNVDCNKYDSLYTWRDLFNMVYVNTYDQFCDWYKAELEKREQLKKLNLKPI